MRVNRRFLYWGVLLVAVGGVLVAADLRAVDASTLTDVLRLWPLAVVAIGLSLVLRKTRLSLPGLVLAAAVPGLVVGGALAVAPRLSIACGARGPAASVSTTEGTFEGPATVSVKSGCGSIDVTTVPGNGWRLDAGSTAAGRPPTVNADARSLSINPPGKEGLRFLDGARDEWFLTLPAAELESLSLVVNAGQGQYALTGARIGHLAVTANAAEMAVDASAASVAEVSAAVNVGSLSIRLPAGSDIAGSLKVGAGRIQVCVPPGLGLRLTSSGTAEQVTVDGIQPGASNWQSPNYESATHHADLLVRANFGAVEINPIGGCP
jgi:hypothetical protein